MQTKLTYIAWPLVLTAVCAWAVVGLFLWTILSDETDRVRRVQSMQDAERQVSTALRLHAVAQDTESTRKQLDDALRVGVVSLVEMIEASGKEAGVKLISNGLAPRAKGLHCGPLLGRHHPWRPGDDSRRGAKSA